MESAAFVQLALDGLKCSQKELAIQLDVSPTQISKWKKGEYMSPDMSDKFRVLTSIGDRHPEFVAWAGTLSNAIKWERLIAYLADMAYEGAETGYDTVPLKDEMELLCWQVFYVLGEMGVSIPAKFPAELDIDYEDEEKIDEANDDNLYLRTISEIFRSLNDVYGFYVAYVYELMFDDELDLFDTPAGNIDSCLLELAASKIQDKGEFTPNFRKFKYQTEKNFEEWLMIVKDHAFRAGIPLRAELLDMIYASSGELGHDAEAESLGINVSRIHPDVYMNELLVGMRVIHQVLPAILKKLGIDDEFKLDESDLRLGR